MSTQQKGAFCAMHQILFSNRCPACERGTKLPPIAMTAEDHRLDALLEKPMLAPHERSEARWLIVALRARAEKAELDAKRYRWARKQFVWEPWMTDTVKWVLWLVMPEPDISAEGLTEDSTAQALDRAIDRGRWLSEKDKGG